jgi:heptosyltransferase-2
VGDTVMATGVLSTLRARLPDTELVGFMRPGLDQVLDGTGWLDQVQTVANRGPLAPLRIARMLRGVQAEAVLLLPNSFRWALTTRLAGVPVRVGYARDARGGLLTHPIAAPHDGTPRSAVVSYSGLAAAALGVDAINAPLRLAVTTEQAARADALLDDVPGDFALLNPGANRPAKRWPPERFAAVADDLAERRGLHIVVSGSPGEASVLRSIIDAARPRSPIVDLAARGVDLGSLKAVIARARVVVTNDTGPRHIAAALGTPVVTLFGPTDHRWTSLPGASEHLLVAEPFLPEELIADDLARWCRIDRITVADVLGGVEALLGAADR